MADKVSFSEFGPQFIAQLLTGQLLESQVRGAIAARIWIDESLGKGFADFKGVDPVFPKAERCQVSCDATVHLTLNITITPPLLPPIALPPIDAAVTLTLIFKAYSPLYLLADIPEITAANVKLEYKMHNPVDWLPIELGVRSELVKTINTQVKNSRYQRVIDFEALLLELVARAGEDEAAPAPTINLNARGDILVPRDDIASGQISPGQSLTGSLLLNKNERLQVRIYGRVLVIPGLMFSYGANGEFSIKGKKQADSSTFSVDGEAWGDNYSLNIFPDDPAGFKPAESGWYQFALKTEKGSPSECEFLIKQKRSIGDVDLLAGRAPICFDELGRNFFHIGLSKEMMRGMIAGQMQKALQTNKLQQLWNKSPFGPVLISLLPTLKDLLQVTSDNPEGEVLWKLDIAAKLKVMRGNEQLFMLPLEIRPTLALVATKNPTAIQVELRPLKKGDFTVDEKDIKMLDSTVETLVKALLHGNLADQFEERVTTLSEELLKSVVLTTNVISAIAEKRADATRPKPPEPRPVFEVKSFKPVIIKPGGTEYYKVTLKKRQTVVGSATISPQERPGLVGATASLAICDDMHGLLGDSESNTWNPGETRKKTLSLRFTPPDDGSYQFRVRANPPGGEEYAGVNCEFKITEAK